MLIDQSRRLPIEHVASGQGLRHLGRALRVRDLQWGIWLMALPAVVSGVLNVLGPLRLHRFGAGTLAIGATFLIAAGLEATISPYVGRFSDRHGRIAPVRFGLAATAGLMALFTAPSSGLLLAVAIVAVAISLGAYWAPAMALLSDAAERGGLDQALAAAVMNLAWATGQIMGSGVGGATAKLAGDIVPTIGTAGLCALTLAALTALRAPARLAPRWSTRRPRPRDSRSGGG